MRCKEVSKGSPLPEKYFSPKVRCSYCYLEWGSETKIEVRSKKICKKQKKKISSRNEKKNLKKEIFPKELEQICSFCKKSTVVPLSRPKKEEKCEIKPILTEKRNIKEIKSISGTKHKPEKIISQKKITIESQINIYANAKEIFSLKNNNNTLANSMNKCPKVIKNSKKKKDKFAGLCQKAVLASVKLKEEQKSQNKLNLFLKPSS
ncbi:uncharacterized protein LOC113514560 isoform X2 [Galleria mellonella]|nr:uncharacterized protein LOC113514560 isoform X2 [Galleria mellonella]XP_031764222.1 uncharacterized protein LOC113514560 isoform X2 [Galleria mellonella]XP_052752826.1 uncharacterized protein LOC113514560 isoform X2 [Galleria mellonella]